MKKLYASLVFAAFAPFLFAMDEKAIVLPKRSVTPVTVSVFVVPVVIGPVVRIALMPSDDNTAACSRTT